MIGALSSRQINKPFIILLTRPVVPLVKLPKGITSLHDDDTPKAKSINQVNRVNQQLKRKSNGEPQRMGS